MGSVTKAQDEAAEWVVELPDASPERRTRFSEWLTQAPQHVHEYLLAAAMYTELDTLPTRPINREQLIASAIADIRATSPASDRSLRSRRWPLALAAGFSCVLLGAGAFWLAATQTQTHATQIGEIRSFELEDGTVVHLNADSRVQVSFSKEARTVRLVSGEALFRIGRDAERPFKVESDATTIRALGTQFNVNRRPSGTSVAVLEGRVQVTHPGQNADRLAAGEGARIDTTGHITRLPKTDVDRSTAWLQRRLMFLNDPLADIAGEFNRFNRAPKIRVEGTAGQDVLISGVFDADDLESFLLYLGGRQDLEVNVKSGIATIRKNALDN